MVLSSAMQVPSRRSALRDRTSAVQAASDFGDPSITAGPGRGRVRKDMPGKESLASPQGKKLRLSDAADVCSSSDAEQSLPAGKECVACLRATGRDVSFYNPWGSLGVALHRRTR